MWFKNWFSMDFNKKVSQYLSIALWCLTGTLYQIDKSTCIFCFEDILNNITALAKMISKPV